MELGKLKLLHIDEGSEISASAGCIRVLDAAYFSKIDAVLLDVAACQEKRIDAVGKGGPRPEVSTDPGDDSYSSGSISPVIPATATGQTRKLKAKIACSVPYDKSCRQAVIQSAVTFIREKASMSAQANASANAKAGLATGARRASDGRAVNLTPIPPDPDAASAGRAAGSSSSSTRYDINADMDAELAELQSLRDQRQWRHTLMARLERTSRVTAAHTHLPPEVEEEEGGAAQARARVPSVRELMGDLIVADDW
jgi:hypothetical protein